MIPQVEARNLHSRFVMLQLLMDLGVKSATMPRHGAWMSYMEFLATHIQSKAW